MNLAVASRWLRLTARVIAVVALSVIACTAVAAADMTIADFVGRFRGQAHSESGDSFFVSELRDVEVDLQREGEGFRLAWSTLIHGGAPGDDEAASRTRLRESLLHFVPAAKPGQFRTVDLLEPFAERPSAWAYLEGNALIVHVMTVSADGNYELQTYVRTLSGEVMALRFTRIAPGKPDLVVVGELKRRRD